MFRIGWGESRAGQFSIPNAHSWSLIAYSKTSAVRRPHAWFWDKFRMKNAANPFKVIARCRNLVERGQANRCQKPLADLCKDHLLEPPFQIVHYGSCPEGGPEEVGFALMNPVGTGEVLEVYPVTIGELYSDELATKLLDSLNVIESALRDDGVAEQGIDPSEDYLKPNDPAVGGFRDPKGDFVTKRWLEQNGYNYQTIRNNNKLYPRRYILKVDFGILRGRSELLVFDYTAVKDSAIVNPG